jgi:peptidoglycan/xylan/chitin deacetylase (PgdA/CDA1 family)
MTYIIPRKISITFDDGFKRSADIAAPILKRFGFLATFYIVTGWVEPARAAIREVFNVDRPHGSWDFWRKISNVGHEVGSHSFSHLNARGKLATLFPWLVARQISKSFDDLEREITQVGYTMAMPWNAASRVSDFFVRRWFAGCRLGSSDVQYNDLSNLSRYALKSWAPSNSHTWADYVAAIDGLPDGGWLILQYHSFGDEGYDPVSPELFDQLCQFIASRGIPVQTVREVLSRCKTS